MDVRRGAGISSPLRSCNDGQHITLAGTFQRSSSQTPARAPPRTRHGPRVGRASQGLRRAPQKPHNSGANRPEPVPTGLKQSL
jgi:hypothetical protein